MLRDLYRYLRRNFLHYLIPMSRSPIFNEGKEGVEVVGLFYSATGIGESARLCAKQLQACGYKVRCRSVESAFRKSNEIDWSFKDTAEEHEIGCRIIHLNPPMLPPAIFAIGLFNYKKIFNIGYWAWELERIPTEWRHATRYVNAIFTPSNFTTRAIQSETSKSVITIPHPVSVREVATGVRKRLGIPENTFLVSCIFSFGSAVERKNPWAVITAFIQAFGTDDSVCLLLKSSHGKQSPEKAALLKSIEINPNIMLVDALWDADEVAGLIKESDLYVSLHRSEGFGLTIAEAMLAGTPTMVSDWSGSSDFCTEKNSFPVRVSPIPVRTHNPEFSSLNDLTWADADVDHAAELLYGIYSNREIALSKAEVCLNETNSYFSVPHYAEALGKVKSRPQ